MEKKKRWYFPDEFKHQALEPVETSGLSLFEITVELGVHESELRRWARQYGQTGALTTHRRPFREVPGLSLTDFAAEKPRLRRELPRAQVECGS